MSASRRSDSAPSREWWRDAVVYQIYPRSFQDSDGDGIGDLPGILSRLDHVAELGADAIWLSPIYPSPGADLGYDVSDHCGIDPRFGTAEDFDALLAACRRRGLRLLLDLIPSHTSIEHPWFRQHPERYVWSEDGPPNNWRSAFGGPAWSRDSGTGRWYLHTFYPEQPDLDWRNPDVRRAFGAVIRHWLDRGVDGFRVDAVDGLFKDTELRDDPPAGGEPFPLPLHTDHGGLAPVHSRNAPDIALALAALREAAGRAPLVGEVYLPTASLGPYLEHLDLVFPFELFHAPWEGPRLAEAIAPAARLAGPAWVMSNHDFPRLASRLGERNAAAAAVLLLTLPGAAFVYQGEEIGMVDGPGGRPPVDRAGRDRARHPMQWDASPGAGFSTGEPWLPVLDPERRNVADQRADPDSMLSLYRRLISLRRELDPDFALIESGEVLAYRRGDRLVAINPGPTELPSPAAGRPLLIDAAEPGSRPGAAAAPALPPGGAVVVVLTRP